jgi:transcriptional regulator with PAS, ATPase and Fis domain
VSFTTGSMQEFAPRGDAERGAGDAGLVLLYAETFAALPAAWPLGQNRVVIGREPPAEIVLPVNAVSRVHAELSSERGTLSIRDLGSRNGVIVNGRRVDESPIEPFDEIRIGDALFKFVASDVFEYARYRIDGSMASGAERSSPASESLIGGFQMDRIAAALQRIAGSLLNVMVLGPSGTGKEVVARELHRLSGRSGAFLAVNCAAIPAHLLESELFGFKRGAFSGADRDKPGIIRMAHRGTLLFDEIGDMPLEAQAKLLRVIQSKELLPLGATQAEVVDVRIACATHRDLGRLQREGRFREDLYARLNEYEVRLPPLHERKEDIYALTRAFMLRQGRAELVASVPFWFALLHHDWPYNVRELEAAIKRAIALASGPRLELELLPDSVREAVNDYGQPPDDGAVTARDEQGEGEPSTALPAESALRELLDRHRGNVAAVGRELGKARMQIHRWMKRYGIEVDDYRR